MSEYRFENGIVEIRGKSGESSCSMVITGDCCPWKSGLEMIKAGKLDELAGAVKPFISEGDIRVVQFETPLTNDDSPIDKSGPNLKCSPEALDLLEFLDFNVALLANNHIGDHGGDVVMETIDRLESAGIKTVGAGADLTEASKPLRVENDGISINILNFAEHEFGTATPATPGCAALDPLENIKAIREANETADFVVVTVHGGHERHPLPSPRMTRTYRAFIDAGAAAVFNCHTHCPGPVEVWNGAPIIYSPGNFFFPWPDLSSDHLNSLWWRGYLVKLLFDENGVHSVELKPAGFDNNKMFSLSDENESGFFSYLERLNDLVVDDGSVTRYFEAWCAKHGGMYLTWLRDRLAPWPVDLSDRSAVKELLPVRNIFTCEAHNDLMRQYLRLVEEGRVETAMEGWPAIEELQAPEWARSSE